jgi:hypothetical protein
MASCGIWRARDRLVAMVAYEPEAMYEPALFTAGLTDEERWGLLHEVQSFHGLDCPFVVASGHAKIDAVAHLAADIRAPLWIVEDKFVDDLRLVSGISRGSSKRLALLLARLGLCSRLRLRLCPLSLQLPLL